MSRQIGDRRQRCPRAQPQGRHGHDAARRAGRHHRPLGLGQVVAGVRHDLRRGPAPLRRVAERLRPPVPGADGQAGRGLDRGPVAGDLDRPEDDVAQPAVDGRHGHRDLRLPAPAVGADRQAALLQLRPPDRRAVGGADHRPDHGLRGGHAVHGPGADRARPQGRVPRPARAPALRGLHAREGRRRAAAARGGHRPRQEVQARRVGGRGPADHAAGHPQAAGGLGGDRGRAGRRDARRRARRRTGEVETDVLGALRLPALRDLDAGARAALVLLQLAARRLPALHRPRLADGDRPGPRRAGPARCRSPRARSCRGRAGTTAYYDQLIRGDRRPLRDRPRRAVGGPAARTSRTCSCTARTGTGSTSPTATGWAAGAPT